MSHMRAIVWLVEGTWEGCVDAAKKLLTPDAAIVLVYVIPMDVPGAMDAAVGGLLGRWRPGPKPGVQAGLISESSGHLLLDAAAQRLGRPNVEQLLLKGRAEGLVIHSVDGADLLVAARDGDRSRLGPHSLGHTTRFVVDHAPCQVLLVWPESPPPVGTIPEPHHLPKGPKRGGKPKR